MRLFVAAELDDGVRTRAAMLTSQLRAAADADGRRAISWVAAANLHFTLQFVGEVDAATGKRVETALAPVVALVPFDVAVGGVGTFPPSGPPRVIWLGVDEGGAQLSRLAGLVNERLDAIGQPREDRAFKAHLTIGRVKGPVGPCLREALADARHAPVGRCTIDRVTLFESRLTPRGSIYSTVTTTPLGYHQTS
jgi:RNA 2',3'-cyclic 3'-phosphodiesterase